MKKSGFTLAEVLITLGIVGVVSALVLPTFTTKMQTAKVGPRLAKAVAGFEQANIAILDGSNSDALSGATIEGGAALLQDADTYFGDEVHGLVTHMKGSYDASRHKFYAADGAMYCLTYAVNRAATIPSADQACEGKFKIGDGTTPHLNPIAGDIAYALMIDIDGDNGPNSAGRDIFFFQMMDDGSLRPWGGSWEVQDNRWTTGTVCPKNKTATVKQLCAGHVMENGLKVEYK